MITFNMIGAGRVGKAIVRILSLSKIAQLSGVVNRTLDSSIHACNELRLGLAVQHIVDLPRADLIFITCNDDAIENCCENLAKNKNINQSIVVHMSGLKTSRSLDVLKRHGCSVASFHPMYSFSGDEKKPSLQGVYCAVEGDKKAIGFLQDIFTPVGAILYEIDPDQKALYHAAGVFISNYSVVLCDMGINLLEGSGIEAGIASEIVKSLFMNTANNVSKVGRPINALTGPAQRGDEGTIESHLSALKAYDHDLVKIYEIFKTVIQKVPR